MEWQQVIENPFLQDLPFKIELNKWGKILMSPASNNHGMRQYEVAKLIDTGKQSGKIIIEFPAGLIDDGEDPLTAAKRELLEETGYTAESWDLLGVALANPTSSNMNYYFFHGKNCQKTGEQKCDAAEQIETFIVKDKEDLKKNLLKSSNVSVASLAAYAYL